MTCKVSSSHAKMLIHLNLQLNHCSGFLGSLRNIPRLCLSLHLARQNWVWFVSRRRHVKPTLFGASRRLFDARRRNSIWRTCSSTRIRTIVLLAFSICSFIISFVISSRVQFSSTFYSSIDDSTSLLLLRPHKQSAVTSLRPPFCSLTSASHFHLLPPLNSNVSRPLLTTVNHLHTCQLLASRQSA
jgi:hypothetical protein